MFSIEMLPAANGDALLVEYGATNPPSRILIDGGTPAAYKAVKTKLKALQAAEGPLKFELLVVTHVDDDHIGGILGLLEKKEINVTFGDVWFNGYGHLMDTEPFGPVQGERLTTALLAQQLPWNLKFSKKAVLVRDDAPLPQIVLPGGMTLTLLSPDRDKLTKLAAVWEEVCEEAGLDPNGVTDSGHASDAPDVEPFGPIDMNALMLEQFHEDKAEANGSSIAFLAEYGNKRVLFGADAHPTRLMRSIDKLVGPGKKLTLDVCKLSHHGSDHNTSPDLLARLVCKRFLVSTSGAKFKHPHRAAMARVIRLGSPGKELIFNYRSDYTNVWEDAALQMFEKYQAVYPTSGDGIRVSV